METFKWHTIEPNNNNEETMKLKCKKCGCDYEKPSVFKEYIVANNNNVFYRWSLTFCDRCRKEKERESLKFLPDVMKALGKI